MDQSMNEPTAGLDSRSTTRRRLRCLPLGFLGMLALMWGAESFVWKRNLGYLDETSMTWRLSGAAARRESKAYDVLCLGDSMSKFGLIPRVIKRFSGKKTYNLSVNAARPAVSYFLLRRALDAGAQPTALVFEVAPTTYPASPLLDTHLWAELASIRDCVDLAITGRDPDFFANVMAARFLPSLRYRRLLRIHVLAAFRGEAGFSPSSTQYISRNLRRNQGAMIKPHNPDPGTPVDVEGPVKGLFLVNKYIDNINNIYIGRLIDLAYARHISVYWLIPPINVAIQDRREEEGCESIFTQFIAEKQARYPNLTVIDGRKSRYPQVLFWDRANHLDVQGADLLSFDLATILKNDRPGEAKQRWIPLPAYRVQEITTPLEDMNQSAVALKAAPKWTRR